MTDTIFPAGMLASLLQQQDHTGETGMVGHGVRWACWDEGVLLLEPAGGQTAAFDLLLSCGIHGNETAPIELVDELLTLIAGGAARVASRVLLVFGNPAAIRCGERYLTDDLNRLFSGEHRQRVSGEALRAALLEQYAQRFFAMGNSLRLHLDLHTAIRGSYYPVFAICPAQGEQPYVQAMLGLLREAQIGTLLLQDQPTATFTSYNRQQFNARALTLELGQARPLGQNQGIDLEPLRGVLQQLIAGSWPWPDALCSDMRIFRVTREIIRTSEHFRLNLDRATLNFTPQAPGSVIAEDGQLQLTASAGEHIIFPNPDVAVGLRAVLLVTPQTGC